MLPVALRRYRDAVERKRLRMERAFAKELRKFFKRETQAIRKAAESPLTFASSLDAELAGIDLTPIYRSMYMAAVESFKIPDPDQVIKAEPFGAAWETVIEQHLLSYGLERITEIRRTTKALALAQLEPVIESGLRDGLGIREIGANMARKISEYAPRAERYRAERIARTEIVSASNWASMESVRISNVSDQFLKRWLPAQQENTRVAHAEMINQPPIEMDELFEVDGEQLAYPGDPSGSPGNVINCRCTLVYVRKDSGNL